MNSWTARAQRLPLPLSFVEPIHSANDDVRPQSPSVVPERHDRTVGRHQQWQSVESLDAVVPHQPRVRPSPVPHIQFAPRLPVHQRLAVRAQRRPLFAFFQWLSPQGITSERVRQLCESYEAAELQDIPRDFDFLLNYREQEPKIVGRVTEIILRKSQQTPAFGNAFSMLFNRFTQISKLTSELFATDVGLLKQAYFAFLETDIHGDYDGRVFNHLLDRAPDFILEYVNWRYRDQERPGRHGESRDYTFLWKRQDYLQLGVQLAEQIYGKEKERGYVLGWYLQVFFAVDKNRQTSPDRTDREDELLNHLIEKHSRDQEFMQLVFGVVMEFEPKRRGQFVARFLKHNKTFGDYLFFQLTSFFLVGGGAPKILRKGVLFF